MATKLYPTDSLYIPRGEQTPKNNGVSTIDWLPQKLSPTQSVGSAASGNAATLAGPLSTGIEFVNGTTPFEWVSPPLDADVTISGLMTFNIWGNETNMTDNAGMQVIVERMNSQMSIVSTVVNSERGTELATSLAVNNWTATPTSTAFNRGDRFRVTILINDAGGNMATGSTCFLSFSGPTATASGDTWIQFNETLTFMASPTGSVLYMRDTASSVNPGAATEKEAWTTRGAASTNSITNTVTGYTTPIQITNAAGGTAIEWYSRPLTAFTLGGITRFNIRGKESNTSANVAPWAEVAICANDGSSPTIWGACGVDPTQNSGLGEFSTTDAAWVADVSGDDTAITNGQRLRFRIYINDAFSSMATGFTVTITYDGPSSATAGDTYVTLPQSVTEFVSATSDPPKIPHRFHNGLIMRGRR